MEYNNNNVTFKMSVTAPPVINMTINTTVNVYENCVVTLSSDGNGDVISPETLLFIYKVKAAIIIPLLFTFGCPTNVLNIAVFFKQGLNDRVNLTLFSLAFVDLATVSFYFLLYVEHIFMFNSPETSSRVNTFLVNNKIVLLYSCIFGEKFLTAIISVERCICIMLPLHAKTLINTKTMAAVILVGVPIVSFLRLAVTAKYAIVCFFDLRRQVTFTGMYITDYAARNREMLNFLDVIFYGFIMSLGCRVIVLITTLISIGKLWQIATWRRQISSAATRNETAVTKMLLVLCLMFLVYNIPLVWARVYPFFNAEFNPTGKYQNFWQASVSVGEIMICMDASLRFVVYYSASSKYRQTCRRLLKPSRFLKGNLDSSKVGVIKTTSLGNKPFIASSHNGAVFSLCS